MHLRKSKILPLLLAVLALGACTPTIAERGNMLQDYQVKQVVTGVHTRSDILRILGSPTTKAPFDDNTWYYIGQETAKHGILDPEVVKERIIILTFNDDGVVQNIEEADPKRLQIPIARDKTPTHGNDITVMQQLLGNIGKFNTQEGAGQ